LVPNATGQPTYVSDANAAYDPLHFVLLHPHGETGWHPDLHNNDAIFHARSGIRPKHVTVRDYAAFFLHDRVPHGNAYHVHAKRLLQEWIVDEACKMENQRLHFMRTHQTQLRTHLYRGLADQVAAGDVDEAGMGHSKATILPSTYVGSPRYFMQLYQDSMAIVRALGKPSVFLTMTCNPKWPDIVNELKPGEQPNDRPDLIARAFRLKLDSLLHDVRERGVLGAVLGDIHVVEFQK
jgi:hypothetical protein